LLSFFLSFFFQEQEGRKGIGEAKAKKIIEKGSDETKTKQ